MAGPGIAACDAATAPPTARATSTAKATRVRDDITHPLCLVKPRERTLSRVTDQRLQLDRVEELRHFLAQRGAPRVTVAFDGMRGRGVDEVVLLRSGGHDHEFAVLLARKLPAVRDEPLAAGESQLADAHVSQPPV